jgi:hypothetical protein
VSRRSFGLVKVSGLSSVPYPFTDLNIGRYVGNLPNLIEVHDDTVREFERVLVQNLKGGKIDEKRPTILLGDFSGIGGEAKDAIDHYACAFVRSFYLRLLITRSEQRKT